MGRGRVFVRAPHPHAPTPTHAQTPTPRANTPTLRRMISTAARCSLVCGCGTDSFAAMSSSAPSMTAAPLSIVAIRMSCPGQSTKLTWRTSSIAPPQCSHGGASSLELPYARYDAGRSHAGHLKICSVLLLLCGGGVKVLEGGGVCVTRGEGEGGAGAPACSKRQTARARTDKNTQLTQTHRKTHTHTHTPLRWRSRA